MIELSTNDLQSIGNFIAGAGKVRPVVPHEETLRSQRNDQDRVLCALREHGGSMGKRELHAQIKLSELDAVLQELERAGKIKLTEIKGCRSGGFGERPMVIDYLSQSPEKIPKAQPPSVKEGIAKHWWQFWK